jgi:hypothetical protein
MERMRHASMVTAMAAGALLAPLPPAAAAPPGFPDLSTFTAVDPTPYISVGLKGDRTLEFVTPTQLKCSWQLLREPNAHTGMVCAGNIPAIPDEVPREQYAPACDGISTGTTGGASPLYTFLRGNGPCPPPVGVRPLSVGDKITEADNTCTVTGDGVACIDPIVNHGFVLAQLRSWVF